MLGVPRRCRSILRLHQTISAQLSPVASTSHLNACLSRCASKPISHSRPSCVRMLHQSARLRYSSAAAPAQSTNEPGSEDIVTEFSDLASRGLIEPTIIRTMTEEMGLETMTPVQSQTIKEALTGKDVLAQAKTGTGKTIAFVLPILQRILSQDPSLLHSDRRSRPRGPDIRAIIISPTRELAEQIAVQTRQIVKNNGLVVQVAVGGTEKNQHVKAMRVQGCHVLVATPGRLKDLLSDPYKGISAPNLDALVLDEADRLMDGGFWPEIEAIQQLLPNRKERDRQTLLFSATLPDEVVQLARSVLKRDMHFVQTISHDEAPTHERVPQMVVALPELENQLPALLELCERAIDDSRNKGTRPFKAIVYFNTALDTDMSFRVFRSLRADRNSKLGSCLSRTPISSLHARLTQSARTNNADAFRNAESGILMSSDVSARGMDFPNVTHVIQMGVPVDRDTYIHRLGRTARAGKEGEGWLFVTPGSSRVIQRNFEGFKLQRDQSLEAASANFSGQGASEQAKEYLQAIKAATSPIDPEIKEKCYLAQLGVAKRFDSERHVESLNRLTKTLWDMPHPPGISPAFAAKLGLSSVRALRRSSEGYSDRPRRNADSDGRPQRDSISHRNSYTHNDDRANRGGRRRSEGYTSRNSSGESSGYQDRPRSGGYGDRNERRNQRY